MLKARFTPEINLLLQFISWHELFPGCFSFFNSGFPQFLSLSDSSLVHSLYVQNSLKSKVIHFLYRSQKANSTDNVYKKPYNWKHYSHSVSHVNQKRWLDLLTHLCIYDLNFTPQSPHLFFFFPFQNCCESFKMLKTSLSINKTQSS